MSSNVVGVIVRLVDDVSNRVGKVNAALNSVGTTGAKTNTTMQALGAGLAGLTVAGVYLGLKRMADAFVDVSKEAAQFDRVLTAFKYTTTDIGENFTNALGSMRVAARGTISDMNLLLSANKALALGVATSTDQLGELIKVSTVLGRRTGLGQEQSLERLFVGIGRLSPRILDDLGIAVNLTNLYRTETGKAVSELTQQEKIQILLNHVLGEGAKQLKLYKDGLDDTMSSYERFSAAVANFKIEMGQSGISQFFADALNNVTQNSMIARVEQDAADGKASIAELGNVIEVLNGRMADLANDKYWDVFAQAWKNSTLTVSAMKLLGDEIANLKVQYRDLLSEQAVYESLNNLGNANKRYTPVIDYEKRASEQGAAVMRLSDMVKQAQIDMTTANMTGDAKQIASAQFKYDTITHMAQQAGDRYNSIQEELGGIGIDVPLFESTGEIKATADAFDVIKKQTEDAAAAADAYAASQKKVAEALAKVQNGIHEVIVENEKRMAMDVASGAIGNQNPDAARQAALAQASLKGANYYTEYIASAWQTADEANASSAASYAFNNNQRIKSDEEFAASVQRVAALRMDLSGDEISNTLTELADARRNFDSALGTGAEVEAANRISQLQDRLVALAIEYNKFAAEAGLELVDVDALRKGNIEVQDTTGKLGLFNSAQSEVKTFAELAGSSLEHEAAAADMLKGSISGAANMLMTKIAGLSDVMDAAGMNALFETTLPQVEAQLETIFNDPNLTDTQKYFQATSAINTQAGAIDDMGESFRNADSEAKKLADTIKDKLKSAYDSLQGIVSSELSGQFDILSTVGVNPEDFAGGYKDVPAENAKRLAAIMKEGIKDQSWLEEFKNEVPQIWKELSESPEPQKAAAAMLVQFKAGMRPELIDFTQLKQQIKDKVKSQLAMKDLADSITNELITEMGQGKAPEITAFVSDALGVGIKDAAVSGDTAIALLDQFNSETFASAMINAGTSAAGTWGGAFTDALPEHVAQVVEMLATLVAPVVQAKNDANKKTTTVK